MQFDLARRVLDFASRKREVLFRRQLAVAVAAPEQHTLPSSNVVARYPLIQVEGDVSVYRRGDWYELVVVSWIHGDLVPFFKLRGRHRKLETANRRAQRVARNWGKD